MQTIDSIVEKHKLGPVQFLKLDVQGAELLALQGAKKTLVNVEILQVECPVMNYNQGAPSFANLSVILIC